MAAPVSAVGPGPASSPAALSGCRDLVFEAIQEPLDLASSYALSAKEAAFRGSAATLEIHLRQLRICVVAAIQIYKELDGATP
jgi:hypothetical protein